MRDIAVCGALDDASLRCFKEGGPTVAYDAGETVAFEGDAATSVYTLTAGLLRLSRFLPDGRRQIAGFLFPGDFLGLTLEKEHAFTVQAVVPSTLCRFPRPRFDSFAAGQPALERRLYALAAQELAAAREQLVLLGRKTATERIASFLLMLARRGRAEGTAADDIRIPVSRADMGDYLGLRIETVSRELSNLKAARVIQFTGRQTLRLCDRDRIEQLAEG
uniref:Crp/Fnr family transcriptional regulator n=1 Tax=Edaphosphingomonas laterariae TaxID=861865 RepID=UPI0015C5D3E2|nr:helix-turn-helix domain-containing protein [Sphingomonas laterariae]